MLRTFFMLLLALCCGSALAQPLPFASRAELRKFADDLMENFGAGNDELALSHMKPRLSAASEDFDEFAANFKKQSVSVVQRYGPAIGSEFVREEMAGKSLVRMSYMVKHQKSAMRWLLVFYHTDKGWLLAEFKFDGNINALFSGGE